MPLTPPVAEVAELLQLQSNAYPNRISHFAETHDRPKMVTDDAALACGLVESAGIVAASVVFSQSMPFQLLRCCVAHCATKDCGAIERANGWLSDAVECGACPVPAVPHSGCWPTSREWQENERRHSASEYSGGPPWQFTTCHSMISANATNVVHIHYFLAQQEAARRLLSEVEAQLCTGVDVGSPDAETTYYQTMHRLLGPYRQATRMHTHFAFLAKTRCVPAAFADRARAKLGFPMSEQAK